MHFQSNNTNAWNETGADNNNTMLMSKESLALENVMLKEKLYRADQQILNLKKEVMDIKARVSLN